MTRAVKAPNRLLLPGLRIPIADLFPPTRLLFRLPPLIRSRDYAAC